MDEENAYRAQIAVELREIMEETRWSAARLAREIGVSGSTITRALDEDGTNLLSSRTIQKLRSIVPKKSADLNFQALTRLIEVKHVEDASTHVKYRSIPVVGYIHADVAYATDISPVESPLNLEVSEYGERPLFAFVVRGHSTDEQFEEGDYAIAEPAQQGTVGFEGDIVIVRRDVTPDLHEYTLMGLSEIDIGPILIPRDPAGSNRDPLSLEKEYEMPLRIVGIVVARYALRKRRFGLPVRLPDGAVPLRPTKPKTTS